jgi:hypothetical protein
VFAVIASFALAIPSLVKPLLRVFDQICETGLMPLLK